MPVVGKGFKLKQKFYIGPILDGIYRTVPYEYLGTSFIFFVEVFN